MTSHDALLVVSFGGPEGPDEVMPFLEHVTRGRGVPRARLLEVAAHYQHFGGVSPIQAQVRALIEALRAELPQMPIFWGNRHCSPWLRDAVRAMREHGVRRALALTTSAFGGHASCRQYLEDIERARAEIEGAPPIDKIRPYFDHPGFVHAQADRVREALARLTHPERATLLFTAHSIPVAMARASPYEEQVREASRLVAETLGIEPRRWQLAWQSRSGPAEVPWLEPDVLAAIERLGASGSPLVLVPIGFTSDHMEVVWDLDVEALARARDVGLEAVRAGTVGTHPRFVRGLRELVEERTLGAPRRSASPLGPRPDVCPAGCCMPPARA